jgi:DNA-binding IclR family transcriptional regulator
MARPSPQTDRVVALVELLASQPGEALTLAEVTRRLEVNKSTCHSMLTSLATAGWLLRDPARKTYRLGPALVAVSRAAATSFPALEFARPPMVQLAVELGVNCAALGVHGDQVTVLDQVRDLRSAGPALPVGAPIPLRPPFGTVVLAWAGPEEVERWLSHVPADTHVRYLAALTETRRRGFAVEISIPPETRLRDFVARLGDGTTGRRAQGATITPELLSRWADELADNEGFLPLELKADQEYIIGTVNAPVFDAEGRVSLVVSLSGFGRSFTGRDVEAIADRLLAVTSGLTAAVRGTTPRAG